MAVGRAIDVHDLTSCGYVVPRGPEHLGTLRESTHLVDDPEALRRRMAEDGYLYLRDYLDREQALQARWAITASLAAEGHLDPAFPAMAGMPRDGAHVGLRPGLARHAELQELLYSGAMLAFYRTFLGGPIRHYDFTWLRVVGPGRATPPHCDIVFMGRGTRRVFTSWTPLGDVPLPVGGLMILEGSHRLEHIQRTYGQKDVDRYCANRADADEWISGAKRWGGWLARNPVLLRERLGGRWLTADFRIGDVLVFGMDTIHASLDNQTSSLRISCDARYQLASEPVDERWVGEHPVGHTSAGKRGRIC